ncbi:MAG TPA: helix-turn-helix transcriptional regulator [Gammaproteobacteria bacterium]|nr:helix-turn-helix transcriptional regulator [Gammaproteobacteria bacterium]
MKNRALSAQRAALGQLLKTIREEQGLLQREVAQRLNAPQSFVSKYESGERRIDLPELRQIAQVLDVSFETLLRRFEDSLQ